MLQYVWVFNSADARFPGGIFTSLDNAERWIGLHLLSGTLTRYPVDMGAYEWAIEKGLFSVTKSEHTSPAFIGGFTDAGQEHFHYEDGSRA